MKTILDHKIQSIKNMAHRRDIEYTMSIMLIDEEIKYN